MGEKWRKEEGGGGGLKFIDQRKCKGIIRDVLWSDCQMREISLIIPWLRGK